MSQIPNAQRYCPFSTSSHPIICMSRENDPPRNYSGASFYAHVKADRHDALGKVSAYAYAPKNNSELTCKASECLLQKRNHECTSFSPLFSPKNFILNTRFGLVFPALLTSGSTLEVLLALPSTIETTYPATRITIPSLRISSDSRCANTKCTCPYFPYTRKSS